MEQNDNFSKAVDHAVKAFEALITNETTRLTQQTADIYGMLANVYAVHVAGEAAPEDYANFLKEKNVVVGDKAVAKSHPTVSAFVDAKDRKAMKQRISQYAQCVDVLGIRQIPITEAVSWFDEPEEFERKTLRGIAKARRIYASLPDIAARNQSRHNTAATAKQIKIEEALQTAHQLPSQVAKLSTSIAASTGQHVVLIAQVNAIDEITILHVIDDRATCDSLILRHLAA